MHSCFLDVLPQGNFENTGCYLTHVHVVLVWPGRRRYTDESVYSLAKNCITTFYKCAYDVNVNVN